MNTVRRVELAESWVLHSRPFRETSLIVEAFSREFGRMGLVARGGRRPRSALALAARPFRLLLLSWTGRGELATLTAAESAPQNAASAPPGGERLLAAMYLNELVLRLTRREDPHPELFDHYSQALGDLCAAGPMEPVLRRFELDLLASLGFGLNLRHDIEGRDLAPGAAYCYRMEQGAEALPNGARTGEAMNFSGAELLGIARGDWGSRDTRRAASRLLKTAIDFYLEGKPLNTRKVFAAMR
ncbi:MAG: DNA repair protein RecO [Gammaproteobacteria bacterium]|nr:DNA repair protein RecO [Gammaproteobacteria bacterium]